MFQTHCYDAWLGGAARASRLAMWSHLGGTFPAPLFLFVAGISAAIVTGKLLQKGATARQVGRKLILRGAQVFALGLLFRVQEFVIAWGWAPWSDLFRVDILNTIGLAILFMGAMCWVVLALIETHERRTSRHPATMAEARDRDQNARPYLVLAFVAISISAAISALTPLLWTTWRPRFLPWQLETYINGVHNLGTPQPWLFPIFPWVGFAFAGLALGFALRSSLAQRLSGWTFLACGVGGLALIYAARFVDSHGRQLYPVYDYWHTSPCFFATRVGLLLLLVLAAYAWCRWGAGQRGFSPMIQLGYTSLLVYWVHIEFVYGRFHILPQRSQTIAGATEGLLIIFLSMLLLSLARTTWKANVPKLLAWRRTAGAN